MGIVINPIYKNIKTKIDRYDLTPFDKAVMMLEELDSLDEEKHGFVCYSTMVKAVLETYLGRDLENET